MGYLEEGTDSKAKNMFPVQSLFTLMFIQKPAYLSLKQQSQLIFLQ